jgi:chemotaxis protein CheX
MTVPSGAYRLAPVLDLNAAGALHADLLARRGAPLEIDGGDVQRLGGLCLQVLLSARRTWAEDGLPFNLATPSEPMSSALALLGVDFGSPAANLEIAP